MLLWASKANSGAAGTFSVQVQRAEDTQGSTSLEHAYGQHLQHIGRVLDHRWWIIGLGSYQVHARGRNPLQE